MPREQGAYLRKANWPECIPWTEPTREYWPQAWWGPTLPGDDSPDTYNSSHPAAGSLGDLYFGDVCPYCGVPVRMDEEVIGEDGTRGEVWDVSPDEDQQPVYHRECYMERRGHTEQKIADFIVGP